MALNITDLKKGTIFQLAGVPYRVTEYKQKVMGRGGSIVSVKVKSLLDGKVLDKTFKGSDQVDEANVRLQPAQYLYANEQSFYFMNEQSFEQFEVPKNIIGEYEGYIKEGDRVQLEFFNSQVINMVLPKNVPLKVEYTEGAVKGDTSTSITKDATLETGLTLKVPAFIKQGDIISVDTETGSYRERIKT